MLVLMFGLHCDGRPVAEMGLKGNWTIWLEALWNGMLGEVDFRSDLVAI